MKMVKTKDNKFMDQHLNIKTERMTDLFHK